MAAHLSIEESLAEVLAAHSIGAFSGDSTACQCDRTWRKNDDHRAHVADALTAALAPLITSSNASAWHEGFNDGKRQDAEGDDGQQCPDCNGSGNHTPETETP